MSSTVNNEALLRAGMIDEAFALLSIIEASHRDAEIETIDEDPTSRALRLTTRSMAERLVAEIVARLGSTVPAAMRESMLAIAV